MNPHWHVSAVVATAALQAATGWVKGQKQRNNFAITNIYVVDS